LYSNHFKYDYYSHRGGISWNYIYKKITLRAGLGVQELSMKQTNLYKDSSYARNFVNYFPSANFSWRFAQTGAFYLSYNGNTQQPSLSQLQPILNNIDPLNITIGNPDLKPAFNHNFNFGMYHFKVISKRNINFWGGVNINQNAFSNKTVVDKLGKRTNQTVNVDGNYNYYMGFNIGKEIKFMKLSVNFSPRMNGGQNKGFINGLENTTRYFTITPQINIGRFADKKFDVNLSYGPMYNQSTSSFNTSIVTEYWSQNIGLNLHYFMLKNWVFATDIDANYRKKLSPADNGIHTFVWNASIERKIIPKKDISLIASINDILNQRVGFQPNITSNFISQNTYTTVQRYALLSLRWKFNKNRKSSDN
jgi:hypothetical protein